MYIRNDQFMSQGEQQNTSMQQPMQPQAQPMQQQVPQMQPQMQQPMNYQNYMMTGCPMAASCPFAQMCPIAKDNISMTNYDIGFQGEMMSRPYHIKHPNPYNPMQYHDPHFNPHFNPFFNPIIFTPWFFGMNPGNYNNNNYNYDNDDEDEDNY